MNYIKSLNLKRIVAFFLLSVVLFSSCAPGLVTRAESSYPDVSVTISITDTNDSIIQRIVSISDRSSPLIIRSFIRNHDKLDNGSILLDAEVYFISSSKFAYLYEGDLGSSSNISYSSYDSTYGFYYWRSSIYYPGAVSYDFPNVFDYDDKDVILSSLDLSKDDYRDLDPDQDGILSTSIPTPRIHVSKDYSFGFDNCTDDYYIQMQGRFWSIDDIELYKENLMWKYKYSSSIKGKLNDWYPASSKKKANSDNLSFLENGQTYFDEFLAAHPVDDRNYFGGTNAVGNYFSGYSDALGTMKMLLKQPTSGYNGVEVYVRYFTFDDSGNLIYGKWCHYYDDIAKNGSSGSDWDDDDTLHDGQQSGDGLTDDDKNDVEKGDDTRTGDPDINVPTPDDDYTGTGVTFTGVIELLNNLKAQMGGFLGLFSDVFSFLPSWLLNLIYASIGVCCFLGVWHFIRG